ncbi:hypothetical protein F7725_007536 [Dissostichus mawsoni]|uniref:GABA(C) receptor n=1 Tax=Dissostichus mawsoni TaxID=36200 RepID=A0A7J5Y5L1_DISMA|nr:hypothetical protein F7725_007536 [Dissostichus mawsoni]
MCAVKMPHLIKALVFLLCLLVTGECRKLRVRRWTGTKPPDVTKARKTKTEQLLKVDDHDFTMRPAFGGPAIPVGVDVQTIKEEISKAPFVALIMDETSDVSNAAQLSCVLRFVTDSGDFTMTLYLRHYWKDERLSFTSSTNKSMTFDGRLVKKIWVPDVFFVHSKRSFIHDTTTENIMLRVFPDGHVLYSLRVTVTAACNMDFSRFPLDSQTCSLELESYAYTDEDLMLYWKSGDESLSTDDKISLSQFLIQKFHTTSRLAFYSSTGWYNRLYINFTLRRYIFFFLLQTYFPATLMVMLSWVSFWIDRRAVPARVSLGKNVFLKTCIKCPLKRFGCPRGDLKGDSRGNLRGDLRGDSRRDLERDSRGDLRGDLRRDLERDSSEGLRGDLRGNLRGDSRGNLRRNSRSDSRGNLRGDSRGNLRRNSRAAPHRVSSMIILYYTLKSQPAVSEDFLSLCPGITTVLTMSTIITGVNASMPRVSYIKAVDIYLWVSFVFVFLSVLEYAVVNYLSTVQDRRERKMRMRARSQSLPCTCGISGTRTMTMLDGTYSEADTNSLAGYTEEPMVPEEEQEELHEVPEKPEHMVVHLSVSSESTTTKKKKSLRKLNIIQNTHAIDKYSRMIFPGSYIFFNLIYWSVYC